MGGAAGAPHRRGAAVSRILAIAFKDLRSTSRNLPALAMMLAAPLALSALLGFAFGGSSGFSIAATKVAVVNLDRPPVAGAAGAQQARPAIGAIVAGILKSRDLKDDPRGHDRAFGHRGAQARGRRYGGGGGHHPRRPEPRPVRDQRHAPRAPSSCTRTPRRRSAARSRRASSTSRCSRSTAPGRRRWRRRAWRRPAATAAAAARASRRRTPPRRSSTRARAARAA